MNQDIVEKYKARKLSDQKELALAEKMIWEDETDRSLKYSDYFCKYYKVQKADADFRKTLRNSLPDSEVLFDFVSRGVLSLYKATKILHGAKIISHNSGVSIRSGIVQLLNLPEKVQRIVTEEDNIQKSEEVVEEEIEPGDDEQIAIILKAVCESLIYVKEKVEKLENDIKELKEMWK